MTTPLQVYQSPGIVVAYDPNLCVRASVCVRALPGVFDSARADWIHPAAAPAPEVAAAVARCPSGALQAIRPGIAPASDSAPAVGVVVRVLGDGPALVRGPVTLELPSGATQSRSSFAICRCGRSRESPFCDGSHASVGWRPRT